MPHARPAFFRFPNGDPAPLPFAPEEYDARLAGLRAILAEQGLDAAVLTLMHGIAYHTYGFLYCSFGRPYALVVTPERAVTVSANIDGGQPWPARPRREPRLHRLAARQLLARGAVADRPEPPPRHRRRSPHAAGAGEARRLPRPRHAVIDGAPDAMRQRMLKSPGEIALIREGARIADLGGAAIRDAIRPGAREIDVAMAGRDAMDARLYPRPFPTASIRDSWVWFQSGLNTDGAHNPVTTRRLRPGDILQPQQPSR